MKTNVTNYDFHDAFSNVRPDNFSYEGLNALYEYFLEYEDSCDTEIEFDVVAICCEFSEYEDEEEFESQYDMSIKKAYDYTTVIEFDGGIIIQDF